MSFMVGKCLAPAPCITKPSAPQHLLHHRRLLPAIVSASCQPRLDQQRRARITCAQLTEMSHGGGDNGSRPPSGGWGRNGDSNEDDQNPYTHIVQCIIWFAPFAALFVGIPSAVAEEAQTSTPPAGSSGEIPILKRLLREVFADLVGLKERLDKVEAGSESEDDTVPELNADVSIRAGRGGRRKGRPAKGRSKVHASGQLELAVHMPWTTKGSRNAVMSDLVSAGVRCGPLAQLSMHKSFREEGHSMMAKAVLTADGAVQVTQALYKVELMPQLRVLLSAVGGGLANIAPRVNPFADAGLTRMLREGHDLDGLRYSGAGVAASLVLPPGTLTAGSFVQAGTDGSVSRVSCGQVGVSSPSLGALHLVAASRALTFLLGDSQRASADTSSDASGGSSRSSRMQYQGLLAPCNRRSVPLENTSELGVTGALKVHKSLVVSGWAAGLGQGSQGGKPWGLSLQSLPDYLGQTMSVAVRVNPALQSPNKGARQVMWEVSAKLPTSDGIVLVPGMVLVSQDQHRSMAVSLQTLWRF